MVEERTTITKRQKEEVNAVTQLHKHKFKSLNDIPDEVLDKEEAYSYAFTARMPTKRPEQNNRSLTTVDIAQCWK